MSSSAGLAIEPSAYNDEHFNKFLAESLANVENESSEDFYNRLTQLRNEQKKTLIYMQELYEQKRQMREEIKKSESSLNDLKALNNGGYHNLLNQIKSSSNGDDSAYRYQLHAISAYSTVPLIHHEEKEDSARCDICHDDIDLDGKKIGVTTLLDKPPLPHHTLSRKHQDISPMVSPKTAYNIENESKIIDEVDRELTKIERLWNEYKLGEDPDASKEDKMKTVHFYTEYLDNYNKPKRGLTRSASAGLTRSYSNLSDEKWVPKITVPKPFNMTIRDAQRAKNKKTKCQALKKESEHKQEQRIDKELKECQSKFKAQPVPAHVYVPLYEQKKLNEEYRKQKLKETSKSYLNKVSKPFNITDNKPKAQRVSSATQSLRQRRHSYSGQDSSRQVNVSSTKKEVDFKANPLPEFYFLDNASAEKMRDEELQRKIRHQIRALELLKQSRLPHNMELQEEKKMLEMERNQLFMKEMNRLQKELNERERTRGRGKKHKFYHEVPDFDTQHRKFVIELEMRKAVNRKHTRSKPFELVSATRGRDCQNEPFYTEDCPKPSQSTSMSRLNKSLSTSIDAMPIKSTQAQILRESVNKGKLGEITKKELQQEHIDKVRKLRMKKLHEKMGDGVKTGKTDLEQKIQRQTRTLRLQQRQDEETYDERINDIEKRIDSRPLLIHQIDEENIRRAVEKKYREALRKNGLNENALRESLNEKINVAKPVTTEENDNWIYE